MQTQTNKQIGEWKRMSLIKGNTRHTQDTGTVQNVNLYQHQIGDEYKIRVLFKSNLFLLYVC